MIAFYLGCLRRHQYLHAGQGRHYLAKNPSFSPKIDTLYECFPEARFIYLARSPLDVIPSYVSVVIDAAGGELEFTAEEPAVAEERIALPAWGGALPRHRIRRGLSQPG